MGGLSHKADEIPNIISSFFFSIRPKFSGQNSSGTKAFFLSSCQSKKMPGPSVVYKPSIPIELEAEILPFT